MDMDFKINIDKAAIENKVKQAATDKVMRGVYQVECPHCHAKINVMPGKCYFPVCRNPVELTMNVNFK